MKTKKVYKPAPLALKGKQVSLTEARTRTARGMIAVYEAQIREEMKDVPAQAAREYEGVTISTYLSLKKRLGKDFNLSHSNQNGGTMWVWKGIGLHGE